MASLPLPARRPLVALLLLILLAPAADALRAVPAAPPVGAVVVVEGAAPEGTAFEVVQGPNATVEDGPFHVHAPRAGWNRLHATLADGDTPVSGARIRIEGPGVVQEPAVEVAPGEYEVGFLLPGPEPLTLRVRAEAPGFARDAALPLSPSAAMPALVAEATAREGDRVLVAVTSPERLFSRPGFLEVAVFTARPGGAPAPRSDATVGAWAEFDSEPAGTAVALDPFGGARHGAPFTFANGGLWDLQVNLTIPGLTLVPLSLSVPVPSSTPVRVEEPFARGDDGVWRGALVPAVEGPFVVLAHAPGFHAALGVTAGAPVAVARFHAPLHEVEAGKPATLSFQVEASGAEAPGEADAAVRVQGPDDTVTLVPGRLRDGFVNVTFTPAAVGPWTVQLDVPALGIQGAALRVVAAVNGTPSLGGDDGAVRTDYSPRAPDAPWWAIPGPSVLAIAAALVAAAVLLRRNT